MTDQDEFERVLAASLAPAKREPDMAFVAKVQRRVRIEQNFRAQRAAELRCLGHEILAIAAVGAGLAAIVGFAGIDAVAGEPGAILLTGAVLLFMLLVAVMAPRPVHMKPQLRAA